MPLSKSRISILVCGRTGVGKSALINCILGKDVCKVGNPADFTHDPAKAFLPQTFVVKGFDGNMNGVKVTVYDSPGLQDGTGNDQQYLDDMYEKCRDVDLVLYCHDITRMRWTGPEMKSLRLLTGKFGVTIWKKTILVFTKANCLEPAQSDVDEKKYLEDMIEVNKKSFQAALREVLQATGSHQHDDPLNIVDSLPAVPAGSERKQILPTGPFIGNLWITCMERLPVDKTGAFMKATNFIKRMVPNTGGSLETVSTQKKEIKYLLLIDMERFKKLAEGCSNVVSSIWKIVKIELAPFIPR